MPAQPVANRSIISKKGSGARRASQITQRLYFSMFVSGSIWDVFWPRLGDCIYAAVDNAAYNAADKKTTYDAAKCREHYHYRPYGKLCSEQYERAMHRTITRTQADVSTSNLRKTTKLSADHAPATRTHSKTVSGSSRLTNLC